MICKICGVSATAGDRSEMFYRTMPRKCKECHRAQMRGYYNTPQYRTKNAGYQRTRLLEKEKYAKHAARTALGYALRMGRLTKAENCTICGSDQEIEGHHEDHSKPLEVVWLCRNCHVKYHADHAVIQAALKFKTITKPGVFNDSNHNIHYASTHKKQ